MNGTELRSFSHFQILNKIAYWLILKFVFNQCKAVKISQNDQIQM